MPRTTSFARLKISSAEPCHELMAPFKVLRVFSTPLDTAPRRELLQTTPTYMSRALRPESM